MGTYKHDFTDATLQQTVHAQAHNDVAVGLAALEATVAGQSSGVGGSTSNDGFVDLAVRVQGALTPGDLRPMVYVPRPFMLTYLSAQVYTAPGGGAIDVQLTATNVMTGEDTLFGEAIIRANSREANGVIDPNSNFGGNVPEIPAGFTVTLALASVGTTVAGTDLHVAFGGPVSDVVGA